jgi:hypothetical protein
MMVLMKALSARSVTARTPRPGRPKTSTLSRAEQVRAAKRAQRSRERLAGIKVVPVKLAVRDAVRLRVALQQPEFAARLGLLLDDMVVEVAAYENLALLCWNHNRKTLFISGEDALHLYERNWRLVDQRRIKPAERELIGRLTARYGNGVLHV